MDLLKIAIGLEVLAAFEGVSLVNFGRTDQIRYILALKNNQVVAGVQVALVRPGWYEVPKIWANNSARLGYLMFITALYEFDQLIPDTVLSNASKAIISRWYEKYKDTEYVVEDVREYGKPGPYYAGYKCPPEVIGQLPVKTVPYNQKWADDFHKSFGAAYSGPQSKNDDKSKTLDLLLKGHQIDRLLDNLVSYSDIDEKTRTTWIKKNKPALLKLIETLEGRDREQLQRAIEHAA